MSNTLKRFDTTVCGLAVIMERYLADLKTIRPQWGVLKQGQADTLAKRLDRLFGGYLDVMPDGWR